MDEVRDDELGWIRRGTRPGTALSSALPSGFAVFGALDVRGDDATEDHAVLDAIAPDPGEVLVAGVLVRGGGREEEEPGSEHRLYTDWPYRFRRRTVAALHRRLDGEGVWRWKAWRLPEILFPEDRRFLVSTLWDDSWRSIGADVVTADRITRALPAFERLGRDVDLKSTGRSPS